MHLLIIDGLNLIRRIHAVLPDTHPGPIPESIERAGKTLSSLLEQFRPSHAVVCFDGQELSWRHVLYPEYKAGRKPMPEELRQSLREFRQHFADQGVASLALPAVEADDLAATLTVKMLNAGGRVTLVSTDQGFAQLLSLAKSGSLQLWNHFDKRLQDAEYVQERLGIGPEQLIDYWALTGNATNNIPGVKGIGAKTAAALLEQFDGLVLLLENTEQVASKRHRKMLQEQRDQALLSCQLVRLQTDLELGCNLADFRCKTGAYQDV